MNEGIQYKIKRRLIAESTKNYKLCDDLTEQIRESEHEARKLKMELKNYRTKEKKSLSFKKKRSTSSSESESCQPTPHRPRLMSSDSGSSTEILRQSFSSSPSPSVISESNSVESSLESTSQLSQAPMESVDLTECPSPTDKLSEIASSPIMFASQCDQRDRSLATLSPSSLLPADKNGTVSSESSQQIVSSPGISSLDNQFQISLSPVTDTQSTLESSSSSHEIFQ